MHSKDPIPDAQKTDIIYHWKCPVNKWKKEFQTIEIKPPVPPETTSPQNTQIQNFLQ